MKYVFEKFNLQLVKLLYQNFEHLTLTHLPWDKIAAVSQTTFSNIFSWKKYFGFFIFIEVCS